MKIRLIFYPATENTDFSIDKVENIFYSETDDVDHIFLYAISRNYVRYSKNIKKSRLEKYENKICN